MGFFATFLMCHLYFRHRFATSGNRFLDQAWRLLLYIALAAWAVSVAYSRYVIYSAKCSSNLTLALVRWGRYHLRYHTPHQILWGFSIGISLGLALYTVSEFIPRTYPNSYLGQFRDFLLDNPVSTWIQLRDGWGVWDDGGREEEWKKWRVERERRRKLEMKKE